MDCPTGVQNGANLNGKHPVILEKVNLGAESIAVDGEWDELQECNTTLTLWDNVYISNLAQKRFTS